MKTTMQLLVEKIEKMKMANNWSAEDESNILLRRQMLSKVIAFNEILEEVEILFQNNKNEIINAYNTGWIDGHESNVQMAEVYYNNKYKNENSDTAGN